MKILPHHRHALLTADRSRDANVMAEAIETVLAEVPGCTLLDAEIVLRDGGAQAFLVADGSERRVKVCIGVGAMLDALDAAHTTPNQNRTALAVFSQ